MKILHLSKQETEDLKALLSSSDNECYDHIIKKLEREPIYKLILGAIDGRFGKKVLKPRYRKIWQCITYGTLSWLFIRYVMFPFFDWWDGIVSFLNYVIWG